MDSGDQKAEGETAVMLRANENDAGKRLDAYLASQISDWSRARLQRLIEDEDVLVNGQTVKASYNFVTKMRLRSIWFLHRHQFSPRKIFRWTLSLKMSLC